MSAKGDCYRVAASNAIDRDLILCHGRPVYRGTDTPDPDGRFGHAWCETADGLLAIDKSNGLDVEMLREVYYAIGNIVSDDVVRFTAEQVLDRTLTELTWGPWAASSLVEEVAK